MGKKLLSMSETTHLRHWVCCQDFQGSEDYNDIFLFLIHIHIFLHLVSLRKSPTPGNRKVKKSGDFTFHNPAAVKR